MGHPLRRVSRSTNDWLLSPQLLVDDCAFSVPVQPPASPRLGWVALSPSAALAAVQETRLVRRLPKAVPGDTKLVQQAQRGGDGHARGRSVG
jgi:hypothetical protein